MIRAAIGLGANLGDAAATLEVAVARLRIYGRIVRVSPFYRSKAWGVTEQPDFVNAVLLLDTKLSPQRLLRGLKAIEATLGRIPTFRWGPRALDLDILTYGDVVVHEPSLQIPHPRLFARAFVLAPLADLEPRYARDLAALPEAERANVQRIPMAAARTEPSVDWDLTLERVRSAAEFCASAGLARFRIDETDLEIEIRRSPRAVRAAVAEPVAGVAVQNGTVPSTNGAGAHGVAPAKVLKAEFVGIVRLARPAVAEGAELAQDRELAYVESLGIRNPIRAGGPGRIAQIFVTDGQAVEYGQPLFAIETNPA